MEQSGAKIACFIHNCISGKSQAFAALFNPTIDLPPFGKRGTVAASLSRVLFEDPSLDLCILAQMNHYTPSKLIFSGQDCSILDAVSESLSPLFESHLSAPLVHSPIERLISASALFEAVRSSVVGRMASTIRALKFSSPKLKKRHNAIKRISAFVKRHTFRSFSDKFSSHQKPNTP